MLFKAQFLKGLWITLDSQYCQEHKRRRRRRKQLIRKKSVCSIIRVHYYITYIYLHKTGLKFSMSHISIIVMTLSMLFFLFMRRPVLSLDDEYILFSFLCWVCYILNLRNNWQIINFPCQDSVISPQLKICTLKLISTIFFCVV